MTRQANGVWRQVLLATSCLAATTQVGHAASTVLPSGFSVGAGAGSVSAPTPTTRIIHQTTDKAVFNWSSFSISSGAAVGFQQPGAGSIALNRVGGAGASQINGSLRANGQVWLVNPNGVFFGAGSQVNVGGLLATTADIRNQDFLAGNYSFSGATGAAIANQGEIRAASGGSVVLAGTHVANSGLIRADLGTVQLAAGKSFALDLTGDKLISFQVTAPVDQPGPPGAALISNTGTLGASGGRVLLTARAAKNVVDNVINTTGIVEAKSASLVNGEIVLDGGDSGTVHVAGRLDASGQNAGANVSVLGNKIDVAGAKASSLKASGGSISLASVTTTGVQSYNGLTTLVPGTTLTSAGGAVRFNSSVTLGASGTARTLATIDTTNKGATPAGAGIRFAGTLGGAAPGLNDLTLKAGTAGNVIFNQAVSGLGALNVVSASNVQLNAADGTAPAFNARSLAIKAGGNVTALGSISTNGQNDSHGGLQNAGDITIAAGGNVSLGSVSGTAGSLFPGLSAKGGDATVAGAVAGNGGALAITAASIALPAAFDTRGGSASLTSAFPPTLSSSDGGNGGAVTLHATGGVSIGNPANPNFATSDGGGANSAAGHKSGSGGAISISGARVALATSLDASGGSSDLAALANGGNGGPITISATAGDIAVSGTTGNLTFIESQGGQAGGLTNMQHVGTGTATGGRGGAISLSATGAINLPNTFGASGGGFAAGLGQGGDAAPITLRAQSGGVSWSDLFANSGGSFLGNDGSGAPVTITSGGAVSLSGEIDTRYFGTGGIGKQAGAVTVNALGNIAIGTGITGINLPAISSSNSGLGTDGAVNIIGASILLPAGAVADLGGTHHASGGTIALTATDPANGSVSSGPLAGTSIRVAAPRNVTLGDVAANAGGIVLDGGSMALNGPLSSLSGNIFASSLGPIEVNAPLTATGGNVLLTSLGGTGITVTNSTVRARNTATDLSTNGTVAITGKVTLTGSTESAGTGRVVSLHGP
jgi:filamentous hemagglutinin family protein